MNRKELLADRLDVARRWTQDLLDHTERTHWFRMPGDQIGHIAWQMGHLAVSQVALIHVRCFGLEEAEHITPEQKKLFGRGSTPVADMGAYPSLDEITALFDRIQTESLGLIRGMDEATLDEPTGDPPHPLFATRAGAIGTAAMHESFHTGQIAIIRRLAGLKPLR